MQVDSNSFFISSNCVFSSSDSGNLNPSLVIDVNFLPSYSVNCCKTYSSIGSVIYNTLNPLLVTPSTNDEPCTDSIDSPEI